LRQTRSTSAEGALGCLCLCSPQRSRQLPDRLFSSLERRPTAMPTAPTVNAAAAPQITPIKAPDNRAPVAQYTPPLTTKDTTTKTIADKMAVPAILAIIPVSSYPFFLRSFTKMIKKTLGLSAVDPRRSVGLCSMAL
jgi:hypothetical protein